MMTFDFETLIQLEEYHLMMANRYTDEWFFEGDDDNYAMAIQHIQVLKAIRKEIENRA